MRSRRHVIHVAAVATGAAFGSWSIGPTFVAQLLFRRKDVLS